MQCRIKVGKWVFLTCFWHYRESIKSFTSKYNVEEVCLCSWLSEYLFKNACWILLNAFLHQLKWSCGFSSLPINIVDYIDWVSNIKTALHLWKNYHLVRCIIVFKHCWILFINISLRIFMSITMRDIDL